ncbi:MAG: adenylate/guanylate cyclase domain-containing protein [Spirochaetes bacterium]|nr:adenylate/guanylate cyclase domain-containing protein [Spirochaetota bacterium]
MPINKFENLRKNIESNPLYGIVIGCVLGLLIIAFVFTDVYRLFEYKLFDVRFKIKPQLPQWEYLTFLDIDDNSITNVGQFPWPRYIYAQGLEVIKDIGPKQIAFDIQFMDKSPRYAQPEILKIVEEKVKAGKRITYEELNQAILDSDKLFSEAISKNNVILAYSFLNRTLTEAKLSPEEQKKRNESIQRFEKIASIPVPKDKQNEFARYIDPTRVIIQYPIPEIAMSAKDFGYVDSDFDMDGIARRIRLIRVFKDRIYFHMAMVMLMDLMKVKKSDVEIVHGKHIILHNATDPITLNKRDYVIPIDDAGMAYVHWSGEFTETFNHVSFYALLEYSQLKDTVHEFFDEQEVQSKNTERSRLYGELATMNEILEKTKDLKAKQELWKKITNTRQRLYEIERGYIKNLENQLMEIQKQSKESNDTKLQEAKTNLINFINAARLVLEVDRLKDHSCIIGLTATASHDIGVTPLSSEYLMVGTYHNFINTVLQQAYIHQIPQWIDYSLILFFAIVLVLAVQRLSATGTIIAIVGTLVVYNIVNIVLFSFKNLYMDQLGVSLAILLPSAIISSVKFMSEESQKRYIKEVFSKYMAPRVVEELIKDPGKLQLGGELRNISIFFSDVAGFSSISEKLTPPQLVALLNEYLSEMTDIILRYEGTVDKYEGDAIIAFFGAPLAFEDHPERVCLAAIDMKRRLAELREEWRKKGTFELKVRMGINTGDAVVGNMGSRQRMDYTMMGDAVNLASRLEGANKYYGTYTMISETTYERVKDIIEARELDLIRVVGKEQPIKVYELLGKKGTLPDYMYEMLKKYNEGLALFRERQWDEALSAFKAGVKIVPDDGPCKTYIERCKEFAKTPPPKKWDGVYRLKTK